MVEKLHNVTPQRRRFRALSAGPQRRGQGAGDVGADVPALRRGAAEGEREEECSSTFNVEADSLRWQAAQILRGLRASRDQPRDLPKAGFRRHAAHQST